MRRALLALAVPLVVSACSTTPPQPVAAVSGPPSGDQRIGLGEWDIRTEGRPLAAGDVRLTVTNTGAAPHDLVVDAGDNRHATRVLRSGESQVLEVHLVAGQRVVLWCSVAGHRAQGMELQLPVQERGR